MTRTFLWLSLILTLLMIPFLGAEPLSLSDIRDASSVGYRIFWELRIPRLIFALGLGGVLSVLGSTYQTLLRNPLCEPYILGVSSAVILGIIFSEVVFTQPPFSPLNFFWGGAFAFLLIIGLVLFSSSRFGSPEKVVLFGVGSNFILSSLVFVLMSLQSQSVGGGAMKWLFGFLPWLELNQAILFLLFSSFVSLVTLFNSRALDSMTLGDSVARTLGTSPGLTRNGFLVLSSIVLAITVSFSGTVGFVGLVVPHFCRLVFRPTNSRQLIPLCFVTGAVFLGLADGLSRSLVPPFEFPVGIITTLLGGPLFLGVLWRRK